MFFVLIYIAACDSPMEPGRSGDKLSGYVSTMDSNLVLNGGFYSVSIFNADLPNPFTQIPVRTDSLNMKKRDYIYDTPFTMEGVPDGRYYIAATWSVYPRNPNEVPIVLGTYGCDTASNCSNHILVVYPNYDGQFRNLLSWTDLGKRLF